MAMEKSIILKRRRHRNVVRLLGLMFGLVGTLLFVSGVFLLLDPSSTITCNGVVTTSPGCKKSFTAFGAVFAAIGLGILFAKDRWLDVYLVWEESLRSMLSWRRRR